MEWFEAALSATLLILAGTMSSIAFLAERNFRDPRFLSVGVALLLLVVVGATSLYSNIDPTAEPSFDVGLVPLVLLVLTAVLLNLPILLRLPGSRAPGHG